MKLLLSIIAKIFSTVIFILIAPIMFIIWGVFIFIKMIRDKNLKYFYIPFWGIYNTFKEIWKNKESKNRDFYNYQS